MGFIFIKKGPKKGPFSFQNFFKKNILK